MTGIRPLWEHHDTMTIEEYRRARAEKEDQPRAEKHVHRFTVNER